MQASSVTRRFLKARPSQPPPSWPTRQRQPVTLQCGTKLCTPTILGTTSAPTRLICVVVTYYSNRLEPFGPRSCERKEPTRAWCRNHPSMISNMSLVFLGAYRLTTWSKRQADVESVNYSRTKAVEIVPFSGHSELIPKASSLQIIFPGTHFLVPWL